MSFFQDEPVLGNQYTTDRVLQAYLARTLPKPMHAAIKPELSEAGELAGGELYLESKAQHSRTPELTQWDAWGKRVDRIEVTPLWEKMARIAAEKGLIAIARRARERHRAAGAARRATPRSCCSRFPRPPRAGRARR